MQRFSTAAVIVLMFVSQAIYADGALTTADLLTNLAKSNPQLVQTLGEVFVLEDDASGVRIGTNINPRLGGTRIGPYKLHGHLKCCSEPKSLIVTLNTDLVFLDAEGHKSSNVATAASVKEEFKDFKVEVAK